MEPFNCKISLEIRLLLCDHVFAFTRGNVLDAVTAKEIE